MGVRSIPSLFLFDERGNLLDVDGKQTIEDGTSPSRLDFRLLRFLWSYYFLIFYLDPNGDAFPWEQGDIPHHYKRLDTYVKTVVTSQKRSLSVEALKKQAAVVGLYFPSDSSRSENFSALLGSACTRIEGPSSLALLSFCFFLSQHGTYSNFVFGLILNFWFS